MIPRAPEKEHFPQALAIDFTRRAAVGIQTPASKDVLGNVKISSSKKIERLWGWFFWMFLYEGVSK